MHEPIFERITQIREWLIQQNLSAFIIPHEDEYLGEYLPDHNERLLWATGFTGSAGVVVITLDKAALFVDGRYTVQVSKQTPASLFEYHHLIDEPFLDWIDSILPFQSRVGFDPKMHRSSWLSQAQDGTHSFVLTAVEQNPVDLLWHNRPFAFESFMRLMPIEFVGQSSQDKRNIIAGMLKTSHIDSAILTQLDSICWLLNIRGLDVSRLPVLLSHAIIHSDSSVDFFISSHRVVDGFSSHVGPNVNVVDPALLQEKLSQFTNKQVLVDPANTNAWITLTLQNAGANIVHQADPCLMAKAVKNETEVAGMKACHIRDGVAMVKFLSWLDQQVAELNWLNEDQLSAQLEFFRRLDDTLVDLSFDTISAAGANAAMCHYNHANQIEYGHLTNNSLYLVDSGGQYLDGTTDITRTIAIGTPSHTMKQQFTLVLKGHIALASARFPKGTNGHQLDILARQHLWAYGYDYDHGTGHGVGHFLSVHEGPQRISKVPNAVALLPGMILSNEPGYYREDNFGIRIENLELVSQFSTQGDIDMFGFESLTRCPIDINAIEPSLLLDHEVDWLNQYHQKVWHDISPLVDGNDLAWLKTATAPLV
jgi:Xaa-Pro aminopeptidase